MGPLSSFDGKVLHDADFNHAEFPDKITFRNARFTGKTGFRGAKFKDVADFTGAHFLGDVDFSAVHFHHNVHFSETEFAGDSDFSKATFHAWGLFNKSRFKAGMTFESACFLGSAKFGEVDFAADVDFRKARFVAFVDFQGAVFRGKTAFTGGSIECKTLFRNARFLKEAGFSDCRFTHPVNFSGASFADALAFERVTFLQFVDFAGAHIADAFVLSPPQGAQGLAPEIRFESVRLGQPEKVRFSGISFERITLMGTTIRGIRLDNPKWPKKGLLQSTKRAVVCDEIQRETPDPQKLARLYQDIRANLKKAGTTADLSDLFYSEMEVRRKQKRGGNDNFYVLRRYFSPYTLLWLTCGYGRRPARLLIAAALAGLAYWRIA